MDIVVMDNFGTKINSMNHSLAIRASLFMANNIVLAGDLPGYGIHYENIAHGSDLEVKSKVLQNKFRKAADGEHEQLFEDILAILHQYKKVKHKSKEQLVTFKRIEKIINEDFDIYIQENLDRFKQLGLPQLVSFDKQGIFHYAKIYFDAPETEREARDQCVRGSHVLAYATELALEYETPTDKGKDEEWKKVFMMPYHFFDTDDWNAGAAFLNINDINAARNDSAVMHKLFSLPNIQALSATELDVMRQQLKPHYTAWHQATQDWIWKCKNMEPDAFNDFEHKVIPAIEPLRTALAANQVVMDCTHIDEQKMVMEIYAGMMPVDTFIRFWDYYKAIKPETKEAYEKMLDERKHSSMRIPFLALKLISTAKPIDQPTELKAVKKSLEI